MTQKLRLPPYFTASLRHQITDLYASTAIADFAIALVLMFEPIFMYSVLHMSVQKILLFNALLYATYIAIIPFGAKIVSRYGYAHGILFSIPFQIIFWVFLYTGQERASLLWAAPFVLAIEKSLFWPAFHSSVARFAQDQQRGREFSVLYAIVNMAYIIGPFIGGVLSEHFGVRLAFVVASAVYACSFIPLFRQPEVFVPKIYQFKDTLELYRSFPKKMVGYFGFGEELLVLNVWPVYIYVVVKDYQNAGMLVTLGTLVATVLMLYVGKITDQYSKRILIKVGSFFYFLVWMSRTVSTTVPTVFAADSLSRTSKDLVFIPLSTLTYERAEATHIMAYSVFFEQSLAIGKLSACILGIVVFSLAASHATGFMLLFILGGLYSLLYAFI